MSGISNGVVLLVGAGSLWSRGGGQPSTGFGGKAANGRPLSVRDWFRALAIRRGAQGAQGAPCR